MRLLFVSDWFDRGGAAIAAQRSAQALREAGHEVYWAAGRVAETSPSVFRYTDGPLLRHTMSRIGQWLKPEIGEGIERANQIARLDQIIQRVKPDVVHVHNLHCGVLPATWPLELSQRVPVAWTLHDMWGFTGGCAYSYDCPGFTSQCKSDCPRAADHPAMQPADAPRNLQARKKAGRSAGTVVLICASHWMADQAAQSVLSHLPCQVVPYALDTETFRPVERAAARKALGVPDDRPVVMSVSASGQGGRKGGDLLAEAMRQMRPRRMTWLNVGDSGRPELSENTRLVSLDPISDPRVMRLAYSAADVHVLPTRAEAFGQVYTEAAACGTLSVGTRVGGVPEAVKEGISGELVPPNDPPALAHAIARVIAMPADEYQARAAAARQFVQQNFSNQLHAQQSMEAYETLMKQPPARRAG